MKRERELERARELMNTVIIGYRRLHQIKQKSGADISLKPRYIGEDEKEKKFYT